LSALAVVPSVMAVVLTVATLSATVVLFFTLQNGRTVQAVPNVITTPLVAVAEHSPATSVDPAVMVQAVPTGTLPATLT
jgi:hypothetical protein